MTNEKGSWLTQLIAFSLVPISQLVLYFSALQINKSTGPLEVIRKSFNMNSYQMIAFQIISVLVFSVISFLFMYLIDWLLLRIFSKSRDNNALFISLVLAVGLGNIASIIVAVIFKVQYPQIAALVQLFTLTGFYYSVSVTKDKVGSIVLGAVVLLLNIVPAFVGTQLHF